MNRAGILSIVLAAAVTGACGGAEEVGTGPTGTSTTTTTTATQPTPRPTPQPSCVPTAPGNLRASSKGTVVTLEWDASPGAIEYVVLVGTTPSSSDVLSTNTTQTTYTATMKNGYLFARVQARGSCGWSGSSNEVGFTVGG
jgi:hypothetical protein